MFALWKRYRHVAAVAPLMLAMIATAAAQAPYPNRNITLVLPFAAGSGTDTTTRLIGKELGIGARRQHRDRQQGRRQRLDRGELCRRAPRPTATRCS